MPNLVIILDVDHTLIHAVKKSEFLPTNDHCYLEMDDYYVHLRPGLYEFLDNCFAVTPYVVLWSSGIEKYIENATKFLLDMYPFYKIITRTTFDTVKKNVDLLMTDEVMSRSTIIFVDDYIDRINSESNKVIVHEISRFEYHGTTVDTGLKEATDLINLVNESLI